MSEVMDAYWAAPPMARTLTTAVVVTSVSVHLLFLIRDYWLGFHEAFLFKFPPEIWRLITCFLLTGPKIGLIMDPYFIYTYLRDLEVGNPKFSRREDLLWYLMTVGGFIVVLNRLFTGHFHLQHGLIIALCYTVTQDQRGVKTNFFFFTVPAQAMPYCYILLSFIMDPFIVPLQLTGIVAAHMYDFLTRIYPEFGGGRNLLRTPAFVSWLIQTPQLLRRPYGTAIHPPSTSGASSGTSTGASPGSVLPDSWKSRGSGHRLG